MATEQHEQKPFFLPDFCRMPTVLSVAVLSELFAIILTLANTARKDPLAELAMISLFMQWAGISSISLLCLLRPRLQRMGTVLASLVSYLIVVSIILLLGEVAYSYFLEPFTLMARETHSSFILRNFGIGSILTLLALRYFYVLHQWRERLRTESEARIQALQARIRPHFLFNGMNTIASLVRSNPDAAEEAVEDMADLFRASLGNEGRQAPLADELFLIRRYLHMEQLRLGERLELEWQLEAPEEELRIPPLLFQPLVENAIYHGIEPLGVPGKVVIASRIEDSQLILSVSNPVVAKGQTLRSKGNRMAVNNIRERLEVLYGRRAALTIEESDTHYTVQLQLPLEAVRA